jgi:hypothetical protein
VYVPMVIGVYWVHLGGFEVVVMVDGWGVVGVVCFYCSPEVFFFVFVFFFAVLVFFFFFFFVFWHFFHFSDSPPVDTWGRRRQQHNNDNVEYERSVFVYPDTVPAELEPILGAWRTKLSAERLASPGDARVRIMSSLQHVDDPRGAR